MTHEVNFCILEDVFYRLLGSDPGHFSINLEDFKHKWSSISCFVGWCFWSCILVNIYDHSKHCPWTVDSFCVAQLSCLLFLWKRVFLNHIPTRVPQSHLIWFWMWVLRPQWHQWQVTRQMGGLCLLSKTKSNPRRYTIGIKCWSICLAK